MRAVCAPKCLEKDAHADFLCLHCYPNAVGDNTWAYFLLFCDFLMGKHVETLHAQVRDQDPDACPIRNRGGEAEPVLP